MRFDHPTQQTPGLTVKASPAYGETETIFRFFYDSDRELLFKHSEKEGLFCTLITQYWQSGLKYIRATLPEKEMKKLMELPSVKSWMYKDGKWVLAMSNGETMTVDNYWS